MAAASVGAGPGHGVPVQLAGEPERVGNNAGYDGSILGQVGGVDTATSEEGRELDEVATHGGRQLQRLAHQLGRFALRDRYGFPHLDRRGAGGRRTASCMAISSARGRPRSAPRPGQRPGGLRSERRRRRFSLFESAGTAAGSHTQIAWKVDDIEAAVDQLPSQCVGSRGRPSRATEGRRLRREYSYGRGPLRSSGCEVRSRRARSSCAVRRARASR